jgi:hypothetical protein
MMAKPKTLELWAKQDKHEGDRWRLFLAIAHAIKADNVVFYPGCYVDIAPSFVFPSVAYLDIDKRTPRFFGDERGVLEIIAQHEGSPSDPKVDFIHGDYTTQQALADIPMEHFDLLVSLYSGFISEHCTDHLKIGGTLLVNPSHGDVAMASIDPRYVLSGVVKTTATAGTTITMGTSGYVVDTSDLESYLIQKKTRKQPTPTPITAEMLHESNRGIAYTKAPFAYLFTRVA